MRHKELVDVQKARGGEERLPQRWDQHSRQPRRGAHEQQWRESGKSKERSPTGRVRRERARCHLAFILTATLEADQW